MAEFLDTTAISHHLETLLKEARKEIILISPYLRIRTRIWQLIEDAARQNVKIQVVYGKTDRCRDAQRLRSLNGVEVTFCLNVHAKCYLNEELGIVTSLNLYDFSQGNNQEMGVLFRRLEDSELYQKAFDEAQRIVRVSGGQIVEPVPVVETRVPPFPQKPVKIRTGELARKLGILTTALYDKLIGRGYLELYDGAKRRLTEKGQKAGGETDQKLPTVFLWPLDLEI